MESDDCIRAVGPMSDVRALLVTDMVDSTKLSEAIGDAASAALWAAHDRVARDLLRTWRGREIDRTDGFLLLFDSATDAAGYALAYHDATASVDPRLRARAGLHVGPIVLIENSAEDVALGAKPWEVEGIAKPLAARVMTLAKPGRTLLSAAAAAAVDIAALAGHALHHHGHYRLKGISEPVAIAELAPPDAACPPPADAEKAYRVVRDGELWRPMREVRHNLAPERDAFVGRDAELRHLAERLDAGARLLTVLGPGGTGKTRLARRYAMAWLGEWPGGVYFCDLSEARTVEDIHAAVALALGVPLGTGNASAQLGHAIAGRSRCLVILDNFEQVQAHAPATVGRWLDRAAEASFVITSRERLHLPGEEVAPLEPMHLASEAMELFTVRARARQPGFAITAGNRDAVAEIVRLLDGLPLAVELAAARVQVLSPAQIMARMKDRFALLSGARGAAARQATLRAAIDWSWELLAPWEQAALAQCSVFDGGFTLEAAEAIVALGGWPEAPPVLDVINALVDKSLLRTWLPESTRRLDIAEPFFGMYLSIREYASEKLHASGEPFATATDQRHGRYFACFGSDDALDALQMHGGIARRRTLALELDNLVSACRRAARRGESEVAAACFLAAWAILEAQGPFALAAMLGRQVAALDALGPHARARVQIAAASALHAGGEIAGANAMLLPAVALARQSQDRRALAMALRVLGIANFRRSETREAHEHFAAAQALFEALGNRMQLGTLLGNVANLQMEQGRMAEARTTFEAALALHREVGNRAAEGVTLGNLGTLHYELGSMAEARAAYDAALAIHREAGNLSQEAVTLYNLGILVSREGALQEAEAHYRAALRIHRETGYRRGEGVVLTQIAELHKIAGEFDEACAQYDEALSMHREVGNRRFEGGTLTALGELLAEQGHIEASLRTLEAGERLLRDVGDALALAKLLCAKGLSALAAADSVTARAALAEAESIGTGLGTQPSSELGQLLDALRSSLSGPGRGPVFPSAAGSGTAGGNLVPRAGSEE
jgi:predicted ATPase/class 3 adenylate cyclase/Tfp pilus assembly protein PilF